MVQSTIQHTEAKIRESLARMHANADKAVEAVASKNWDAVILGIVSVAEEFRGAMALCEALPSKKRGSTIRDCGREHHAAKARIALALKKAFESK